MASAQNNPTFRDGGSSNRPPCFVGEHYDFWKIRMQAFLEAQGEEIWDAVENGPYVPKTVINNEQVVKVKGSWTDDEKRKVLFDKRAKNILQSALGMDEFFRISHCKTAKEIWDTLEITHEGTEEVKRSKLNTLSQEYEMFRMKPGESILDLQKRFTHLTNHLRALGKSFSNDELNLKVLRSLNRSWQPKVTAISEKKSLSKMSSAALFGKLQEHEIELGRLEEHEAKDLNIKSMALKVETSDEEDSEEEDLNHLVRKFRKFLKKKQCIKTEGKTKSSKVKFDPTCFGCGKEGHIKPECPNMKKSFNKRKDSKRAYIAWEDDNLSTSSESEEEEISNLALMASHDSDDESEVSTSNFIDDPSYDELHNAFLELHAYALNLSRTIQKQRNQINILESKKHDTYKECKVHNDKIDSLNEIISNFEKGHNNLKEIQDYQRQAPSKFYLGYSSQNQPRSHTTVLVKASTTYTKPKASNNRKKSFYNSFMCSYCSSKGHTHNTCYIRKYGISRGEYKWVMKNTNKEGPKSHWGPNKSFNYFKGNKVVKRSLPHEKEGTWTPG